MSTSNKHLYHCLDVMKADKNLSEETKIIMFVEYARLVVEESVPTNWVKYNYNDIDSRPTEYGVYEVYRKSCKKQHYETWDSMGWAYNNKDITHYRKVKAPRVEMY